MASAADCPAGGSPSSVDQHLGERRQLRPVSNSPTAGSVASGERTTTLSSTNTAASSPSTYSSTTGNRRALMQLRPSTHAPPAAGVRLAIAHHAQATGGDERVGQAVERLGEPGTGTTSAAPARPGRGPASTTSDLRSGPSGSRSSTSTPARRSRSGPGAARARRRCLHLQCESADVRIESSLGVRPRRGRPPVADGLVARVARARGPGSQVAVVFPVPEGERSATHAPEARSATPAACSISSRPALRVIARSVTTGLRSCRRWSRDVDAVAPRRLASATTVSSSSSRTSTTSASGHPADPADTVTPSARDGLAQTIGVLTVAPHDNGHVEGDQPGRDLRARKTQRHSGSLGPGLPFLDRLQPSQRCSAWNSATTCASSGRTGPESWR